MTFPHSGVSERHLMLEEGAIRTTSTIGSETYTESGRDGEIRVLRRSAWLVLMALALTACGGGSTATTTVQTVGAGLSGVHFEVHENPG